MSDSGKAVFLSYASQDAGAAKRICDALRAAGVEVWFDQSELVGGDQWDAKIRGQISSCALFAPIISVNTQARREGYFRIEWKLAAQRTHAMADGTTFLLPLLIDGTRDAEALVPAEFKSVQWTKLPGGETSPAFCERVKRLLGGSEIVAGVVDLGRSPASPRSAASKPARRWLAPVIMGAVLVLLALAISRPWAPRVATPLNPGAAPAPVGDPTAELGQLQARIIPDQWQKEDFEAVAPMLDRFVQAHPDAADAWALRSLINSLQVTRNFDAGTKPLVIGKTDAERALRLAPQSPLAELAMGMHLVAMISRGGTAEACRPWIDRAIARLPRDRLSRYAGGVSRWLCYDFAGTERELQDWLAADPQAGFPKWILAQLRVVQRRPDEAEQFAREAARDDGITGVRARYTLFESNYYLRADLAACRAVLQRIPANGSVVHRVVHARWLVNMAEHRWDDALQELVLLPENFLYDRAFHGPKALLAGLAHERAGRAEAAKAQFREAERLLREHMAGDPDNEELHAVLALTLACLGRAEEARGELALVEPLVGGRSPNVYRGPLVLLLAQTRGLLGDFRAMAPWVRKLFAEYSANPFTPASFSLDARFTPALAAPEIAALLKEFAALDQVGPALAPSSLLPAPAPPPVADAKSVAVLAFANLSDDKANEYFSDGISEELLTVLQKIPGLKVSARTSSFSFKGREATAQEIGAKLGVASLVEGSVRRAGNQVRISARLSRAATGEQVWSESYTRDLKDIFAVQSELAETIVAQLRGQLDGSARTEIKAQVRAAEVGGTRNVEAHQLYLQGQYFLYQLGMENLTRAVENFRRAVELDPQFALAWAMLARAGGLVSGFGRTSQEAAEGAALSRQAAQRALAAAPDLALAHLMQSQVQSTLDFDWNGAAKSARRAQELAPNDPNVLYVSSTTAYFLGRAEEAIELGRQAVALDPVNVLSRMTQVRALESLKRFPEAENEARRLTELSPTGAWAHTAHARVYLHEGRLEAAVTEAKQGPVEWARAHVLAMAYWAQGKTTESDAALQQLIQGSGNVAAFQVAQAYAYRRDNDQAFAWLERALAQRDSGLAWMKADLTLRPLHDDPRWPTFLHKMGLADDQLE